MVEIELGQEVRDTITGLKGVAVLRISYLYGCERIGVQPKEVKEGKPAEIVYIDEPQLVVDGKKKVEPDKSKPPAGYRPDPIHK